MSTRCAGASASTEPDRLTRHADAGSARRGYGLAVRVLCYETGLRVRQNGLEPGFHAFRRFWYARMVMLMVPV